MQSTEEHSCQHSSASHISIETDDLTSEGQPDVPKVNSNTTVSRDSLQQSGTKGVNTKPLSRIENHQPIQNEHEQSCEKGRKEGSMDLKPAIPPKSRLVLAVAQEILRLKHQRSESALSDSEIYDDIINLRMSDEDVYDDVVTIFKEMKLGESHKQRPQVPSKPAWLLTLGQPRPPSFLMQHSYEDIYDDIVVQRMQEASKNMERGEHASTSADSKPTKPRIPRRSSKLYRHPRVRKLLQQLEEKRSGEADMEELYDDILSGFANTSHPAVVGSQSGHNEITVPGGDSTCIHGGAGEGVYQNLQDRECPQGHVTVSKEAPTTVNAPRHQQSQESSSAANVERLYENEYMFKGQVLQYKEDESKGGITRGWQSARRPQMIRSRSQEEPQTKAAVSKFATLPEWRVQTTRNPLPKGRMRYDPLPEIKEIRPLSVNLEALSLGTHDTDSDSSETYEDLPLYEDLGIFQDGQTGDPYQDVTSVVVRALELPEAIRKRANRITARERKKFQKKTKQKLQRLRSNTMPEKTSRLMGKVPGRTFSPSEILISRQTLQNPEEEKERAIANGREARCNTTIEKPSKLTEIEPDHTSSPSDSTSWQTLPEAEKERANENSSGEEDAPVPFGKSREVFEMLLDASGIERAPEGILHTTAQDDTDPVPTIPEESDSESEDHEIDSSHHKSSDYFDSLELSRLHNNPELRKYHEAGVIQLRTRSEIEADIEQLTANASPTPPPLPGIQRPRARLVTRADKILHKRFLLMRRHTLGHTQAVMKRRHARMGTGRAVSLANALAGISNDTLSDLIANQMSTGKLNDIDESEQTEDQLVNAQSRDTVLAEEPLETGNGEDTRERSVTSSSIYDDIIPNVRQ